MSYWYSSMDNSRNRLLAVFIKGTYVYYYSVSFESVPLMTSKAVNVVSRIKCIVLFVADEKLKHVQKDIIYRYRITSVVLNQAVIQNNYKLPEKTVF